MRPMLTNIVKLTGTGIHLSPSLISIRQKAMREFNETLNENDPSFSSALKNPRELVS
jgi:hypothetical protein